MTWIADLHIHSKYSRATSRDCDTPHLALWGQRKGIQLIGTGDFTHPKWREELRETLEEEEGGVYRLKDEYRLPSDMPEDTAPRFIVTGEISTIYKKDGKTRKVHHVAALPSIEEAEKLSHRLEAIGNIHSDGRPILGLDSRDLLEIILESCPNALYFPAHIWTPHFSLFGAFSGFNTIEECFGDMTPYVHAMETGLSSDPPMNRLLSMLDAHEMVSNSDAHSPSKLGREANLLSCAFTFDALKEALDTGKGLDGTIEFYPEEGKYHLDGHRPCHCRLLPGETAQYEGRCPVCGRKITVGVLNRVLQLADRKTPEHMDKPFESLIPLPELIGETLGVSADSKKAQNTYFDLLRKLGPEFAILRTIPIEEIEKAGGFLLGEAVRRMREGRVIRQGGYDGEYGVIRVFEAGERETLLGQTTLLSALSIDSAEAKKYLSKEPNKKEEPEEGALAPAFLPNPEQDAAIHTNSRTVAVIAGPGTGKTGTLVQRIKQLISRGIAPGEITAVTFTRQAAREMTERLKTALGKKTIRGLTIGTFHSICLTLIEKKALIERADALSLMADVLKQRGEKMPPSSALSLISERKNGLSAPGLPEGLLEQYQQKMGERGQRDLDDILLDALNAPEGRKKMFHHVLVDEYQDINALQRQLVLKWSREGTLFVIGDPDQSIYGFRGADAACFPALKASRPETEVITLRQNYRSAPEILESALCVISQNPGSRRELLPTRASNSPVRLVAAPDELSQYIWIAKEIAVLTGGIDMLDAKNGERAQYAFSDIAVLCRTHRQLESLEKCLRHDSIPCVVSGRGSFLESEKTQAILAFLTLLTDEDNASALCRALKGIWHCPDSLIQRAEAALKNAKAGSEEFELALSPFDALTPFLETLRAFRGKAQKERPRAIIDQLIRETGLNGKDMEQLQNTAVFFDSAVDMLDAVRMGEECDIRRLSGGKASGAVKLMTLHGSKGLEFPVVMIAGLDDGVLPLRNAKEEADEEEERRLLYVGMTRAREKLILTMTGSKPSKFVKELPRSVQLEKAASFVSRPSFHQVSLFD